MRQTSDRGSDGFERCIEHKHEASEYDRDRSRAYRGSVPGQTALQFGKPILFHFLSGMLSRFVPNPHHLYPFLGIETGGTRQHAIDDRFIEEGSEIVTFHAPSVEYPRNIILGFYSLNHFPHFFQGGGLAFSDRTDLLTDCFRGFVHYY